MFNIRFSVIAAGVAMCCALPALAASPAAVKKAAAECASYGLAAGTPDYKSCVASMADAEDASSGASAGMSAVDRKKMDADIAKRRADNEKKNARERDEMKREMDREMQAAQHPANGKPSGCVTTTHGTNTSTVCP